ncbi:HlyD family efflux transporter periplasmic adaptor subunit [Hippea alviniae]|uniref:HlyD family efflux transporter periplasmic adaptor subunit n=1 Tax=Hippea alviniae TaxID=1279027 RepID=UPI0003B6DD70|nr:HlyD family efflux transporter periplasmic adaptor subunit [Hippea alviniae]
MRKKIDGIWVFLSIIVIVAIPLLYSRIYKNLSYVIIKNAFVSAEVVGVSPSYVSGMITKLYAKEGDKVKKGQIIALIDDTLYKAEVEKKESRLNSILTKLKSIDNQTVVYENLKAEADLASKDVKLAKLMLSYTRVTSPINGIVAKDMVHVGDSVSSNSVIVYIYKPETLYVKAYITPENLEYIKIGKKVIIKTNNRETEGTIKKIGDIGVFSVCNTKPLIPVRINIKNIEGFYFSEPVEVILKR